jgi:hypothetical protein
MDSASAKDRLALILRAQSSVIALGQARECGLSPGYLRWQVSSGRWQRPYPHTYVAHSGPLSPLQRIWAGWAYCYPHGVIGCHAAASLHGLRGYPPGDVHVILPRGKHLRHPSGLRFHQARHIDDGDLQPFATPMRTRIERSLVDMAAHARSDDDAVAILAAGVQQGLTTGDKLAAVIRGMPSVRRRRELLEVCHDLSGGSHSVIEVEAARLFRRFNLPMPDRQVRMTLPDRLARVDCHWDRRGVVAELDGRMHMDATQWVDDLHRQNELGLTERLVLRYPLWTLRFHPERVADQLVRAFDRSRG